MYKVKFNSSGSVERYKIRLVAKGYTQKEGIDFVETFSSAAMLVIVKVLLALASNQSWYLVYMDVKNVFLHGDLFEEVYGSFNGYLRKGESTTSTSKLVVDRISRSTA